MKPRTPPLVTGLHLLMVGTLIRLHVMAIAFRLYRSPGKVKHVLRQLEFLRRQTMGDYTLTKLFRTHRRYYWDMHAPGWPSKAFTHYNEGEMNRIIPFRQSSDYLNSMILAITKKCPLHCSHCYEADAINRPEHLTLNDLKTILKKFQQNGKGVTQVQLSGGEPLSRYQDLTELLKSAERHTDFWLVTSGYGLTLARAQELKQQRLKGIGVSLDHYKPALHNSFRGSDDSFDWVIKAIENAHKAKLAVILSLCATPEFVTEVNMRQYALLARDLGASFILVLEARSVGGFAGKDVSLSPAQEKILEDFYLRMNYDPAFSDMPAVSYHGYHQRRAGCFASGDRYLYIDTDGDINVCPFSRQKKGSILELSVPESMAILEKEGCHFYKHAQL